MLTSVPVALRAAVTFANSVSHTYLITGSDTDALAYGQGKTVPGSARTESDRVTIVADADGFPPAARQTPTIVTAQFTGFSEPAAIGLANLPFVVAEKFTIDAQGTATFQSGSTGTLPPGTLALNLSGTGRVFVPPSTEVIIDLDLSGLSGALSAQGMNSAGEEVGVTTVLSPEADGRTRVSITASEIVEVRLTFSGSVVLYGATSKLGSPEATAPLSYEGSIDAATLGNGRWAASLFVQEIEGGAPVSANVVEMAIGEAGLVHDVTFDIQDPPNPPVADWQPNTAYNVGDRLSYDGIVYEARQAHTSQVGWEPPAVLALWQRPLPQTISEWAPKTAYSVGSQVTYQGITYSAVTAHTSVVGWEPPNTPALWQPV